MSCSCGLFINQHDVRINHCIALGLNNTQVTMTSWFSGIDLIMFLLNACKQTATYRGSLQYKNLFND